MHIEGRFFESSDVEYVGQSNFAKRRIKIDIQGNSMYENHAEFILTGDKVSLANDLKKGQRVEVHFNINGRHYQKKDGSGQGFFQELVAYRIDIVQKTSAAVTAAPAPPTLGQNQSDDDLPFGSASSPAGNDLPQAIPTDDLPF